MGYNGPRYLCTAKDRQLRSILVKIAERAYTLGQPENKTSGAWHVLTDSIRDYARQGRGIFDSMTPENRNQVPDFALDMIGRRAQYPNAPHDRWQFKNLDFTVVVAWVPELSDWSVKVGQCIHYPGREPVWDGSPIPLPSALRIGYVGEVMEAGVDFPPGAVSAVAANKAIQMAHQQAGNVEVIRDPVEFMRIVTDSFSRRTRRRKR